MPFAAPPEELEDIDQRTEGFSAPEEEQHLYRIQEQYPDMTPDSSLGSFGRGAKSSAASGAGGFGGAWAGGALGAEIGLAGGPAAPVTVPVGAAIGSVIGAMGGSAAGEKIKKWMTPQAELDREQAQLELNRLSGHELAGGAGEMIPAFLSPAGAEKAALSGAVKLAGRAGLSEAEYVAKEAARRAAAGYGEKAVEGVGHAIKAGAVMGGAGEAKHQVDTGEFDPAALITHPIEEAIKFGPVGLIPGGQLGKSIIGEAASQILGGVAKAVPDAAVMTLTSKLYDHYAKGAPLDLEDIKDETGKAIPSFMLLNAITSIMHAGPGAMRGLMPKSQEGKSAADIISESLSGGSPEKDAAIKTVAEHPDAGLMPQTAMAALESIKETPITNEEPTSKAATEPEGAKQEEAVGTPEVAGAEITELAPVGTETPVGASEAPEGAITPAKGEAPQIEPQLTDEELARAKSEGITPEQFAQAKATATAEAPKIVEKVIGRPLTEQENAIPIGSTETEVPRSGTAGETQPRDGKPLGQGEQGPEAAGTQEPSTAPQAKAEGKIEVTSFMLDRDGRLTGDKVELPHDEAIKTLEDRNGFLKMLRNCISKTKA